MFMLCLCSHLPLAASSKHLRETSLLPNRWETVYSLPYAVGRAAAASSAAPRPSACSRPWPRSTRPRPCSATAATTADPQGEQQQTSPTFLLAGNSKSCNAGSIMSWSSTGATPTTSTPRWRTTRGTSATWTGTRPTQSSRTSPRLELLMIGCAITHRRVVKYS